MSQKRADEILGLEFDWLASDADGHVAVFTTAGGGFAPEEFLADTDAHDAAIAAILASPSCTTARFAPQLRSGLQNTWLLVAERGLFAFDSDPLGGPYRLVAAPERAIRAADLVGAGGIVARQLVYPRLRFAELQEVRADEFRRARHLS